MKDAVAIVGMGCRLPGAPDLTRFWRLVQTGEVPVREVPAERWDHRSFYDPNPRELDRTYARLLASVDRIEEFCPEHFSVLPRRARSMDPQQRLFMDAARAAIEDAGRAPHELPRRTGVYVGISVSDYFQLTTARLAAAQMRDGRLGRVPPGMEPAWDFLIESVPPLQAYSMVGLMLNMTAANVAQAFDLRGPAFAIDSACSSALVALSEAVLHLRAGVCDAALVGGVYVACTPNNMIAFSRIGAISASDACRPFDERADGFVLGEGTGCVLLRRLEDALQAGDRIWAVVRGVGINNDGRGEGPMTPRLEGQVAALEQAYGDAAMSPAEVGLVEAHGTATRVGDRVEVGSLAQVFAPARRGIGALAPCVLTSVKGNIGHTLAAAGAAGLMSAAMALGHRRIPPLAGYERARGDLPLADAGMEVSSGGRSREWAPPHDGKRVAAVSSFGFGGTNVHVVLEEAPAGREPRWRAGVRTSDGAGRPAPAPDAEMETAELFLLSAPSPALLAQSARSLAAWVLESEAPLVDVAFTLSQRRLDPARLAVVARSRAELAARLERASARAGAGPAGDPGDAQETEGIALFLGRPEQAATLTEVAFLFPGQGAQAPDLFRDLWEHVPVYRERLAELAGAAQPVLGRSFLDLLYPDPSARDAAAAQLTRTDVCQPALAAVELALVHLVGQLGLEAGVLVGHSLGEFVAAAAGGALGAEDAVRLLAERGRLMAELDGDHGAMAALATDRAGAARLVAGVRGAVLANFNHPRQVVVSGATAAVEEVLARAAAASVRATRLAVSHGFHSPIVESVAGRFGRVLDGVALAAPARAVVSCAADGAGVEPGRFGNDPEAVRSRLVRHALAAIDFEAGVRAAWREGARVFVQVGGGSALLSMVSATLAQDGCAARLAVSLAPTDGGGPGAGLATALLRLVGIGLPVATGVLFRGRGARLAALPTSLLETRPFWILRPPADPQPLPVLGSGVADGVRIQGEPMPESAKDTRDEHSMSESDPDGREIVDLFQRQLDLMQGQLEILRSRGIEVTAGALQKGRTPPSARRELPSTAPKVAPAAPAPAAPSAGGRNGREHASASDSPVAPRPAAEKAADRPPEQIEKQVIGIVSRVSALPVSGLSLSARLSADLGLDSLMMVELAAGLQEAFSLGEVPEGLIGRDATLREIVDAIAAHLAGRSGARRADGARPVGGGARPVDPVAGGAPVLRHEAVWTERPLASEQQTGDPAASGATLIATDSGARDVADALAARLRALGREVQVVASGDELAWPAAAGLYIDLSSLDRANRTNASSEHLDVAELRAPLSRACAAAAQAARAGIRPAIVAATTGPAFPAAAGFARALAAEWPDRLVKAIELPAGEPAALAAERIAGEIATSDRTPEVSWATGVRRVVAVRRAPLDRPAALRASQEPARSALVSGGGRGLGGRLALALARAGVARLALIGRRPPDAEVERLLAQIEAAGGVARYFECDVRDAAAVAAVVSEARRLLQAPAGFELLVHAAGVNADGAVEKINAEDLVRVFDTKVAGALNLWRACAGDSLRSVLFYGSWAGRFGNRHQAIYAAANRALSGLVAALAAERPDVRVVAADLPPWEGSGMVERLPEAVQRVMRGRGVPFLSDEVGLAHLLAELGAGAGAAEVVLGAGPAGSGRRDRARVTLDPASPWLADHAPAGEARLPLAAALDLMVAASARVGLSPPLAIRDVQVMQAIAVPDGGRTIAIEARAVAADVPEAADLAAAGATASAMTGTMTGTMPGAMIDVEIWLEADDPLRGEPRLAATGRVEKVVGALPALVPTGTDAGPPVLQLARFYADHSFHGPRMHGIARVDEVGSDHARGTVVTADPSWPRAGLDILGVDGALQMAGYFVRERLGRAALPIGAGECRLLGPLPPASELDCVVLLERADGDDLVGHVDLRGPDGSILAQLRQVRARVVDDAAVARDGRERRAGTNGDGQGNGRGNGTGGGNSGNGHALDRATYRVEEFPELIELQQRMKMVEALGLRNPYFHQHERLTNHRSIMGGVEFINYSSYSYVGLSGHPEVNRAVEVAVARYGTSVSASRVASGEKPLHRELERAIADFLGCEDSVVMVGGHATNVSVIGHLLDGRDLILHDSLAHDSIVGGARLSGARRRPFPHNDIDALARLLEQVRPHARRVLIAVEGVYSMDGDLAPLDRIIELKKRHGALLLVDEAHSLGVLGATGRGIGERFGVRRGDVDLWMGTLSKSLASCGGYIAGSAALVQLLKYTNPGFVYSVGISPANAAAALAALGILAREPERVATLQARSRFFLDRLRERGIDTGLSHGSAVVPCIVPSSVDCLRLAQALYDRRINVQPILYPAVEENLARLRFFVTSGHSEADLLATADAVREELGAINPRHLRAPDAHPAKRHAGNWEVPR